MMAMVMVPDPVFNCFYLDGHLPARVRGLVEEWAELHQQELMLMWESKDLHKIDPLV